MTQGALERALDLKSRGYVSMLEKGTRGKSPSDELMTGLVRALGVSREWLLEGDAAGATPAPANLPGGLVGGGRRAAPARTVEREEQFPSFALWLEEVARKEGANDAVIEFMRREAFADGADPGLAHWRARYVAIARELAGERKAFRQELQPVGDDLEDDGPRQPPRIPPKQR